MASASSDRDYVAIAEEYAKDVQAKRIKACKWVRLACKRHLQDLRKKTWPYYFDEWAATDVCDFIEKLPHIEGVWDTPNIVLEPAQIFILVCIFGWRRKKDQLRRFSHVYIEMARKGAKSTLTAGIALYCLCCDDEPGAQIIIGATTGDQALKVFNPAKRMVEKTPDLQAAFEVQPWARSITCGQNGGFIQPINAKGKTQDGWNPHVGILDELHAHPNRSLFDVITSAFGARRNPMLWVITTAGYDTAGVCYEQNLYVRKILEKAVVAEHYFGIIFTLDKGDDPYDESVWVKANPMLGITPTLDSMRAYAADAKASPGAEGEFLTKRLNIWMNAASAWLNSTQWRRCGDETLSWEDFEGLDCWIGGDLADKDDITALALIAYDANGRLLMKTKFWLPEAVLDLPEHAEGRGNAPYRTWVKQGHIQLTPGDWVDHREIEDQIRAWVDRYSVRKITFDQFAAAQQMASNLNEDLATEDDPLAQFLHKKAASVTDPAKELEARVKSGPKRFVHDDNPVMNWMASNATVSRRRDGTILPIKETPMSPNKIDGIDAAINAIAPTIIPEQKDDGEYRVRFA